MPCILVIDDRPDIRLSLVVLLEDHHYTVIEADNPQIAQTKLKNHCIDLILLDMNYQLDTTSGEEGLTFLTWLQDSSFAQIPTIAMTAWSNIDLVVKAMNLGANDFIEKPWRNKQLLHTVEQQLSLMNLENQNKKLKQQLTKHNLNELPLMTLAEAEVAMVKLALEKSEGSVPKAAILLGLTKASMYRRVEKYGLAKN
jgi:DNA-binding NtrC family response regulator